MNLLTPIAGFLIGYGGIMGYQVIDSTYKGEMPGPKSFGYFIGGMTLLSAATIYALGRTDKVFNAGGLSQFTPNELTQSSAIHGDFDHASLNYSGHQNMILKAEDDEVYYLITFNHINGEYETTSRTIISENESMKSDRDIIAHQFGDDNPIDEGYKGYYSVHDGEWIRVDSKKSMSKKRKKMFNDYGLYAESFSAESDSCQNCESPSTQTTLIVNKYGDEHEYKFCGDGCEGQYMRENKMSYDAEGDYNDFIEDMEGVMGKYGEMKDFDSGYNPQDNLLKARMVVEVDDEDFGDVDFDAEQVPITDWANYEGDLPEQYPHRQPRPGSRLGRTSPITGPDLGAYRKEKRRRLKARSPTLTVAKVEPDDRIPTFNKITFENGIVTGYPKSKNAKVGDKFVVSSQNGRFAHIMDAETMMPEKQCVICGEPYTGYGHNPEPIFPMSRGRCCDVCNATVVIPYRLGGMNFRFGEDFEAQGRDVMGRFVKMDCDLCGGKDEVGYVDEEREFKVCEHCDVDGEDYNPKLWEAETVRKFRNRFDKTSKRGNPRSRAATGVKRNIWKNFFRKDAENMSDELDMVMAQLYEIEDMKNPTPEDLTNYQNLLTRYYGMVRFNAEQKTARVRTMSGKPVSETLRKLKQDKNLSAKDARTRKEIKAENMEVFEAPKTMTKLQAKRKVIALMKPYWLKQLKNKRGPKISRKQYIAKYGDDEHYEMNMEDWDWWDYHVKTVQNGKYADADTGGDTILREALPHSYWAFINYLPINWEGSEKYDDEPYETMYSDNDFCIYERMTPWSEWSAADKRKLKKLENSEDMDFFDYIEQKEDIEGKYDKTVHHKSQASKMNCKHCGPYFKNRTNINNWDILSVIEESGHFFDYWEYPASLKKQVKALIPALKGIKPKPKARAKKTTTKPKAKAAKKTTTRKSKPKAKTGRKAPTISATRRKIGTRMRGNDGKMWEVKKSGKSQRWMAGAETFEAEVLARDWKWKGIKWTPEEEATLSQEEKEVIAEQLYNDWKEDLNS